MGKEQLNKQPKGGEGGEMNMNNKGREAGWNLRVVWEICTGNYGKSELEKSVGTLLCGWTKVTFYAISKFY